MFYLLLMFGFTGSMTLLWLLLFGLPRTARTAPLRGTAGVTQSADDSKPPVPGDRGSSRTIDPQVRRRVITLAVVLALTFPMLLMLELESLLGPTGWQPENPAMHPVAARLLDGEQLAPPPTLPPDIFTTAEVVRLRPTVAGADRDWQRLNQGLRDKLLRIFERMEQAHGYRMVLLEGYRSPERQTALANGPRRVTRAAAGQSYHQYGLAADCAFFRDGRLVISEQDAWAMRGYRLFGALTAAEGLTWGGQWRMRDYGHVEWRGSGYPDPATPGSDP